MRSTLRIGALALVLALLNAAAPAGVLPEDRADVLYHRYQGGGITIDGPSVLVRKKIGENFSVNANYYVDMISSASIDVKLSASKYKEERKQKSVGVDYSTASPPTAPASSTARNPTTSPIRPISH